MDNYKFIQVQGPFKANEDIYDILKKINPDFNYVTSIGIQTKVDNLCKINGQVFKIGDNEILIFSRVKINSIIFLQDESESTLIDCILD